MSTKRNVLDVEGYWPETGLSGRLDCHMVSHNKIETFILRWKPRVWIWWTRDMTANDNCLFLAQGEATTERSARSRAMRSHNWHVASKDECQSDPKFKTEFNEELNRRRKSARLASPE